MFKRHYKEKSALVSNKDFTHLLTIGVLENKSKIKVANSEHTCREKNVFYITYPLLTERQK